MLESKKVNDRISDDPEEQSYLEYMSLPESRIWMRLRARSITGVKANNKKSYEGDLSCRYCKEGILESQEHLQVCKGTEFERRGLILADSGWRGVLLFWRRMMAKISMNATAAKKGTLTQ